MSTPFHEDESINEAEVRSQARRFIRAGIDGILCLGTNGEFFALTFEEKIRIMEILKDEVGDEVPVIAGTGAVTTRESITLTQKAKDIGYDCAAVITPYYAKCRQAELFKHYSQIAEAVDIPMLIYNLPARTGVHIQAETVSRLAEATPNIVGIKDSSGDFNHILRYIEETREDFSVLSGEDMLILWTLLAGGQGGITGIANIYPETLASIYDLWKAGDQKAAREAQASLRPICNCLRLGNPNSIIKRAALLKGENLGPVREPFNLDDPEIDQKLLDVMGAHPLS